MKCNNCECDNCPDGCDCENCTPETCDCISDVSKVVELGGIGE